MVHGMRFASGLHLFSSCCCCCWRRPLKLNPKPSNHVPRLVRPQAYQCESKTHRIFPVTCASLVQVGGARVLGTPNT